MDVKVLDSISGGNEKKQIAEAIEETLAGRRRSRGHLEKQWDEIDRQLRMEPELSHKMGVGPSGRMRKDPTRNWMPEIELPLQAGALETLLSDVRRLRYPSNRDWFTARAALTEQYFEKFRAAGSPFLGDSQPFSGEISRDDADKLVQGFVGSFHNRYDFRGFMDLVDAQALSYGGGVGRMRRVEGRHLGFNAKEQLKDKKTPVMVPRNIRNVYFDDSAHALMHEGYALGPATIQCRHMNLADLLSAANADPEQYEIDEIKRLTADRKGNVELIELEGDFTFDRGNDTVILQDVELTIAVGKVAALVKKKMGEPFSTYIALQYHLEGPQFTYASSPLLKGMPIAKAAAQALNRVIEAGLLKNFPPLQYSSSDPVFAAEGGPDVHPKALWRTEDGVTAAKDVGGDPQVLFQIFMGLVQLFEDVATGVTPARRGAQTKSHTTAFAKQVEEQRGVIRTVDYVRSTLEGQMTRLLHMEYRMGIDMIGRGSDVTFIQEWDDFVELKRGHLPDIVRFMAIGADAPIEEQQRVAERIQSAQAALQIDATGIQLGKEPVLASTQPMIEQILREGGWESIEEFFATAQAQGTAPEQLPGLLSERVRLAG